ncbi:RNA-binding protein Rsf1 isoform X2 [Schistocerca americana]|uniref:RNA-binding protein Rsf1 isoform X2 n=1 Tax=Schistocerca americana TaxID=7009 RepID=UPI001F4F2553|nr:RNA-binding protein Rsf1 isoform X2 [Schistocerca americana]XP_047119145.1 RNA-binding protein Rsf1 isoform X2 [Schistocerca piceifrons]XP_049789266.1 RNA-binding protein Rsf1 isoform X2 [Schistocerca nitens]
MSSEGYQQRGTRVYVGGLNESIKKEDLETEFEKYGKLNNVWVAFNPPGFAFIEFANEGDAESACNDLNGFALNGSKLRVEISRGRGRGGRGGFRGSGGGGRGFFGRGGSRGSYDRGSFRGSRGRGSSRGRYGDDDYSSSRGSYGGSRDYERDGARGSGYRVSNNYYGGDTGSSRYRSRSPVGRGSPFPSRPHF